MTEQPASLPKSVSLQWVEAIGALLKAILWPTLAVIVLLCFSEPLSHAVKSLSRSVENANAFELSTKGLKWNIEQSASQIGGPDLAKQLRNVTPNALLFLMAIRPGYQVPFDTYSQKDQTTFALFLTKPDVDALRELQIKGLVTFDVNIDAWMSWWSETFEYEDPINPESSSYKLRRGKMNPFLEGSSSFIFRAQYRLTKEGVSARAALIDAVAANLSRPPTPDAKIQ